MIAGRWETYKEYLASEEWKYIKKTMLGIYKKCRHCGTDKNLIVHHISYDNIGNEDQGDLIVLCWGCHNKEHFG